MVVLCFDYTNIPEITILSPKSFTFDDGELTVVKGKDTVIIIEDESDIGPIETERHICLNCSKIKVYD